MSDIEKTLRETADALAPVAEEQILVDILTDAADEIERLRKDLETERKKHEWISVKDMLPEHDISVAVYVELPGLTGYPTTDKYVTVCESNEWDVYGDYVTYWVPLPDPPKGEEK